MNRDAYGNAKLANLLFTKGLLQRGFQSYSLHPGCKSSQNRKVSSSTRRLTD